jgi:NitT/TauT family transport system ATP-binding protein
VPYIDIDRVQKVYATGQRATTALADVTLTVNAGEFAAVLGPSGCGKSTLMLLVAGLLRPTAGTIRVAGREVTSPVTDVGIVFQDPLLLEWRTALRNVMLQVDVRRLEEVIYRPKAQELLKSVGLGGFEDHRPRELSGGMRQRVGLCRALVHDPPLLLMDEPFGALDALTREQIAADLQTLWSERRKTVLFITHSIAEAVFLADRVIVMSSRPGRILRGFDIDLPRPRRWDLQQSARFVEYSVAIRETFRTAGVL